MKLKIWICVCFAVLTIFAGGCQSYEPSPLRIDSYRASLESRVLETEQLSAFVDRLDSMSDNISTQFDLSDGISPYEGEVLALVYNPDLRIARLEAGVALAEFNTAGLWQDPVLGYDGANISSPSAPYEFSLMGNLTIPISGRLKVEKERAGAVYESQLRAVVDAQWQTRAEVRLQWAEWASANARVSLYHDVIEQLERINAIGNTLVEAGELNRVQHRLLQVELSSKLAEATEIELYVLQSKFKLLGLLGLSPTTASMLSPVFPNITIPQIEDETARLIESNTTLAVRIAEYQTAEDSLHLEIKKQFPDIVLSGGYGSESNDSRFLFGVSLPLPVINANRAGISKASAAREVARAKAETTFAKLNVELATATITLELKQSQRNYYEQTIVPMLANQTHDIERIVELGEVDTFILLETITRQFDAKEQLLELQLAELGATIDLTRLLGPNSTLNPTRMHQITDENTTGGVQ